MIEYYQHAVIAKEPAQAGAHLIHFAQPMLSLSPASLAAAIGPVTGVLLPHTPTADVHRGAGTSTVAPGDCDSCPGEASSAGTPFHLRGLMAQDVADA